MTRLRSAWESLELTNAPAEGPVAFGDDLRPQNLLGAYRRGLYPFPTESVEQRFLNEMLYEPEVATGRVLVLPGSRDPYSVAWCSPDPRPLILVEQVRVQRSLRRQLRNASRWTTTADACFERVVAQCREGRSERWLTDDLVAGLCRLHQLGYAHSVEVWEDGTLVGGTFGVRVGAVFSADSQFTLRSGAGKTAVVDLVRRFAEAGGTAVDVQQDGEHVRLLGARPVPRARYVELLRAPHRGTALSTATLPAGRLAD
ncbi:leucyl/phenylalanyl-tRNA--protein transferase [Streptomyces lancefieldiae]|uniref:Leucyl/phenylalanyl-tRNA--protein transferase n=1 Tax=Streptomyces lancefieldiae TaxID=3075520 RepID=A0ABU3ARE0_9ACTN|nr:leucyl/phenylalanyl-tRNA--protein transferase [Streptomyces sp. DSM 40712]MDT0612758.1 leucyl/phenylalanyl-tRNA--protein transferase [Streptomyces sp. DSM 40712]